MYFKIITKNYPYGLPKYTTFIKYDSDEGTLYDFVLMRYANRHIQNLRSEGYENISRIERDELEPGYFRDFHINEKTYRDDEILEIKVFDN